MPQDNGGLENSESKDKNRPPTAFGRRHSKGKNILGSVSTTCVKEVHTATILKRRDSESQRNTEAHFMGDSTRSWFG
jgi:hypothetical protein